MTSTQLALAIDLIRALNVYHEDTKVRCSVSFKYRVVIQAIMGQSANAVDYIFKSTRIKME